MSPAAPPLPELGDVAAAMLDLGRELHLELSEAELADRFLTTLAGLFPHRRIALRVLDPRTREPARVYALGGELRPGLESDRVTIKESAVEKTRLKTAVAASARLRLGTRWDSPFSHVAAGFTVPLVASGELYGVLDLGYALGHDLSAVDEPLVLPVANQLALALRNQTLLPWEVQQDRRSLSAWSGAQAKLAPATALDSLPSSKQVAFAERLARIKRRAVPDECFRDKGLMSKWIDGNK